jgi:hypothetical protein
MSKNDTTNELIDEMRKSGKRLSEDPGPAGPIDDGDLADVSVLLLRAADALSTERERWRIALCIDEDAQVTTADEIRVAVERKAPALLRMMIDASVRIERESCAAVAEHFQTSDISAACVLDVDAPKGIAAAIRARGVR